MKDWACMDLPRADVRTAAKSLKKGKTHTDSLSSFTFIIKLKLMFYGGCGFLLKAKPLKNKTTEKHQLISD